MQLLSYHPGLLGYIVHPSAKEIENKRRVELIHDINTLQIMLKKGPLSPEDFDRLMSDPIDLLISAVNDQSSLLFQPA